MGTRSSAASVGADRARRIAVELTSELRRARIDRGLSQADVGRAVGLSGQQVSRIERGLAPDVSITGLCRLLAVVGLEVSARAYPTGEPIRDRAHVALLGRFRQQLHRLLRWRTEVPLPIPGDLRAWDGHVSGAGWRIGVEAETRPTDFQALERRLALKLRNGGVDAVILVLANTRHNRALVLAYRDELAERFPVPGRRAMELLRAGIHPGGDAVDLLRCADRGCHWWRAACASRGPGSTRPARVRQTHDPAGQRVGALAGSPGSRARRTNPPDPGRLGPGRAADGTGVAADVPGRGGGALAKPRRGSQQADRALDAQRRSDPCGGCSEATKCTPGGRPRASMRRARLRARLRTRVGPGTTPG
jgi:transcriptional regulator with XRE-family HTH domain